MATKNPAAVALGKLGGKAKVKKGIGTLNPEERSALAKKAAATRWADKPVKKTAAKKKPAK